MKGRNAVKRTCSSLRLLISIVFISPIVIIVLRMTMNRSATTNQGSNPSDAHLHGLNLIGGSTKTDNGRKKIAYAITVTRDGPFLDGALVLGHAAMKLHRQSDNPTHYNSKYDAELVAIVAPTVVTSRVVLKKFGWKIAEKDLPVRIDEIINKDYANDMKNSGCCGADEFLKLWAYTLTEYHRVVHLDMDSIIFKNMDELYEIDKELLYTGDYNMMGSSPVPPVQGGFLVIRPSMATFEEFRGVIRKGDYGHLGWGETRIGSFWGGQTIQGILPYFYYSIHPDNAQELNRCEYNCMVDNPYVANTENCLDKKPTCQDCRLQVPEKVASAHYTICQKPWTCCEHTNPKNAVLCKDFHDKWFVLRDDFEKERQMDLKYRSRNSAYLNSMGMCAGYGEDKYFPIPIDSASLILQ